MTTIAERIKCVRTDKGLTVKDFAKILDVSTTTVNNYEKGLRTPDCEVLDKFLHMLDVDLNWLVGGEMGEKFIRMGDLSLNEQLLIAFSRRQPESVFDQLVNLLRAMSQHEMTWRFGKNKENNESITSTTTAQPHHASSPQQDE